MNAWLYLGAAIIFEVAGTTALKVSDGMTQIGATVMMALCYVVAFAALAQAVRAMEVGIAYAVWAGAGTALVAVVGVFYFGEAMTVTKLASLALIIVGVVGLNMTAA